MRILIDCFWRLVQILIDLSHFARCGSIQFRDSFNRLDCSKTLAPTNDSAGFGQLHKNNVAQRFLGVVSNSYQASIALRMNPFMFFGVFVFFRICHPVLSLITAEGGYAPQIPLCCLLWPLVKRCWHNFALHVLATDFYKNFSPDF